MIGQQDIIEDVMNVPTPWITAIEVVPKNHDKTKIWLCIDMWEANKVIERTSYPSPSLEDLINILQGSKIYCNLNMNNAFLQFELHPALWEITTFTTHEDLHRFGTLKFRHLEHLELWNKRGIRNITKENERNSWKYTKRFGYCWWCNTLCNFFWYNAWCTR